MLLELNLIEDMTEHEKLFMINKEIWFDNLWEDIIFKDWHYEDTFIMNIVDVRTLIFNPEFMEKIINKRKDWNIEITPWKSLTDTFYSELMNNLHDPVTFLYNLLFNK